ncbi:hypothetical protein CCACVL1_03827 [Corchorus capsularis]|uniref:Uncharacterized protein n=1 Tax=Corchorus capsularis TaxID=210143 RepID=A0A1R3JWX9_COCAP|nr:hypothetical protein CCACVL1_03827 [Corchorus capsularis]
MGVLTAFKRSNRKPIRRRDAKVENDLKSNDRYAPLDGSLVPSISPTSPDVPIVNDPLWTSPAQEGPTP